MDKTIEEFVDIYVYWNTKKDRQGILTRIEALIQSAVSAERERIMKLAVKYDLICDYSLVDDYECKMCKDFKKDVLSPKQ